MMLEKAESTVAMDTDSLFCCLGVAFLYTWVQRLRGLYSAVSKTLFCVIDVLCAAKNQPSARAERCRTIGWQQRGTMPKLAYLVRRFY
jgi:hypothetical protein